MTDELLLQLRDLDTHQRIADAFMNTIGALPGSRHQKQSYAEILKPFEAAGWVPKLFHRLIVDRNFGGLEIGGSDDVRYVPPSNDLSEAGEAIRELLAAYVRSVEAL